jgi:hypothetical protein
MVDSVEVLDTTEVVDMVTSYTDLPTSSYVETTPSSESSSTSTLLLNSISYGGYFLAFVGILFVIALSQKKPTPSSAPAPLVETARPLPSKQKVLPAKTLSPSDLQELAHMQQVYLNLANHEVPA